MTDLIEGPGWATHTLDERPGRFPLSVEAHLMNMTARLVPGATTVTINARYYGLHGLIALDVARRSLHPTATARLLHRYEVVVGGVSVLHPAELSGMAHGTDLIRCTWSRSDTVTSPTSRPLERDTPSRSGIPRSVPRHRADVARARRYRSGAGERWTTTP
jgi:hypothetical protein